MVEGEVNSAAAAASNGMDSHPDDSEAPDSQPVAERDPSERYSRFDIVLGRGAFKTVYKGFDEEEGIEVAWNQVRVHELVASREERDRLFAEIRVLKQLKHKNIMTFYDSWLDQKTYSVNFITEMFTSGTLRQYRKRHKHIDPEVLKGWAWQILCGLVYLHGHTPPIIHRDLKCDNIFINGSEGVVKIGDLGLATLLRGRTAPQSVLGTPEFMAPELYDEEYDDRVDVYSYGMCLLELATLQYPYCECRNAAQIYRKVTLGVRPAGLQKVPTVELAEFINVCIGTREGRPRARQLLKHPYFDTIRQEKCAQYKMQAENGLVTTGSGIPFSGLCDSGVPTEFFEDSSSQSGNVSRTSSEVATLPSAILPTDSLTPDVNPSALSEPSLSSQTQVTSQPSREQLPSAPHVGAPLHAITRPPSLVGGSSGDLYSPRSETPQTADLRTPPLSPAMSLQEESDSESAPAAPEVSQASAPPTAADANPDADAKSVSIEQAASYATVAESLVSMAEVLSDGDVSTFGDTATVVTAGGNRQFKVKGQLSNKADGDDDEKLNLRLRICQPLGPARTVEFDFDMRADTAMSVASEMVEDLSLSHDDARAIAAAIKQEVKQLTGQAPMFSVVDRSAHQPAHQALEAQVLGASPSREDTLAPQPMHKSQKDSMVQQQTAEFPSDVARQQGPDGLQRPNSPAPAPAFDSAAYAAAAAVRTSSPGARSSLLPSHSTEHWEHHRQYHRPPLSSLRPTPINQQLADSQIQPEASSSFTHWLNHDSMPGSALQPTRSDAGSYLASHLHLSGSDEARTDHGHHELSSPRSHSSVDSRSSMASVATAPPSLPSFHHASSAALSEQLRQQVQWGKRGLSPPQEEDRKLPLQKLFDNLHEFEQTVPAPMELAPISTVGDMTIKTQIPAGLASPFRSAHSSPMVLSEPSPFSPRHQHPSAQSPGQQHRRGCLEDIPPRPSSSCSDRVLSQQANGRHPLIQPVDSRRITADQLLDRDRHMLVDRARPGSGSQYLAARAIAPEDIHSGPSSSAPVSKVPSRDNSPLREVLGLMPITLDPGSAVPMVGNPLARTKSGSIKPPVDLHREKELRRKQAADAMKNMEFKSLEGLDSFGLSRGCKTSLQSLAGLGSKFRPSPFQGSGSK